MLSYFSFRIDVLSISKIEGESFIINETHISSKYLNPNLK